MRIVSAQILDDIALQDHGTTTNIKSYLLMSRHCEDMNTRQEQGDLGCKEIGSDREQRVPLAKLASQKI